MMSPPPPAPSSARPRRTPAGPRRDVVMFDFDGVVVDSLDVFATSFIAACARHGIVVVRTVDDVLELFADNVYESLRKAGATAPAVARTMMDVGDDMVRQLPRLRPFSGMPEALSRIGRCRDVIIVTSNSEGLVGRFVAAGGIEGVAAVAGVESGHSKRDKIARVRERYPGQEVYPFVSDTAGDMREARAAGATPLGVGWGWHDAARLLAAGATRVVPTPAQLPAALGVTCGES